MTVAVMVAHSANMPSYNQSISLDEAQSLIRYRIGLGLVRAGQVRNEKKLSQINFCRPFAPKVGNSYSQAPAASGAPYAFPLISPDATVDLMHGASWSGTGDPQPFFQDFADAGAQPQADSEEYAFNSGQTTPKGTKEQPQQPVASHWNTSREIMSVPRGQAMARIDSNSSGYSSVSQTSQASSVGAVTASTAGFVNAPGGMMGSVEGMMMPSQSHSASTVPSWPQYEFNPSLHGDYTLTVGDMESLHMAPDPMGFEQDQLPESSPSSWDDFSSSLSHTSSPATVDEAWMTAFSAHSPTSPAGIDPATKLPTDSDGGHNSMTTVNQNATLTAAMKKRQADAETPRDDFRYKNAIRQPDGLFHCPWEGKPGCNHKPEKLKCNYDKFVDSHLKPYRCKVKSCEGAQFSSTACRLRHEREAHGLHGHGTKPFLCPYEDCDRAQHGNGFPRQWNLRDHMKRVHNDTGSGFNDSTENEPLEPVTRPQPSSVGRKRKTEASQSTSSERKSVQRAPASVNPKVDPIKPLLEQWQEHHRTLQNIVTGLNTPGDVRNLDSLREMQKLSTEMTKISVQISAVKTSRSQTSTRRRPQAATG